MRLPPLSSGPPLPDNELLQLGCRLQRLITMLLFWHPGPCFYRAYTILYVLRRLGADVEIHFGMVAPHMNRKRQIKAHCWLTRDGNLFLEDTDVPTLYPTLLGRHESGISYWCQANGEKDNSG